MWDIHSGKILGFIPYAHAVNGSVVKKSFLGFTTFHAEYRADRWLRKNAK